MRNVLDKETIESRLQMIPTISIHTKLRQLLEANKEGREDGLGLTPVYRDGFGHGHFYTYNGRRIKLVMNFKGAPRWRHNMESGFVFDTPHDIAIDTKTNTIIAFAKS